MSDQIRSASARQIWAAVPFRGPVGSKRRLAGLLDAAERERLSMAMLADVLDVLLGAERIERVLLLSPSRDRIVVPDDDRLIVVEEPPSVDGDGAIGGLNGALCHAQQVAQAGGADSLLIVPADLPMLSRADLGALLDAGDSGSGAIAPDRAGQGTNALLLTPPAILAPSFGEDSFARHRHLAEEAGVRLLVVERPGLALDLDTQADVAVLLASDHPGGRAATLLHELRVERRLERVETAQARSTTI